MATTTRRPRSATGLTVVSRAQRRREDEPAGGVCTSAARGAPVAPATSARSSASAPARPAWSCAARGRRRPHELSVGFVPGEREARCASTARRSSGCSTSRPTARERLPARPPRAHQGRPGAAPGPSRPVRRGAVAGAARDPARLRAGARAAQRADRADPLGPRVRAPRCRPGTASWPATAIALMRDRAAGGRAAERAVRRLRRGARARAASVGGRVSPALARGRRRSSSSPSSPSAVTATSSAASPATDPTATTSRSRRDGRELRVYGSQGQQRLALLALLLAEREVIASCAGRAAADAPRRRDERARRRPSRAARRLLRTSGGQSVITSTDLAHVPGRDDADVTRLDVAAGRSSRRRCAREQTSRRPASPASLSTPSRGARPGDGARRRPACLGGRGRPAIAAEATPGRAPRASSPSRARPRSGRRSSTSWPDDPGAAERRARRVESDLRCVAVLIRAGRLSPPRARQGASFGGASRRVSVTQLSGRHHRRFFALLQANRWARRAVRGRLCYSYVYQLPSPRPCRCARYRGVSTSSEDHWRIDTAWGAGKGGATTASGDN